jgi:hypothetical protein
MSGVCWVLVIGVIGGTGFIVSNFMFMLEVQEKCYVTTPAVSHSSLLNHTETISRYRAQERESTD